MLVKVRSNLYVNTEHIRVIRITEDKAEIFYGDKLQAEISVNAAAYLLDLAEANTAYIELSANENIIPTHAPDPFSQHVALRSRVAVLLRDEFTQGATLEDLTEALKEHYNKVYSAISDLLVERVVVFDPKEPLRYYHATHRPNKPVPERQVDLIEASVNDAPFVAAMRAGELQCVECSHQSCATCVTASACCQCNQPAFTQYAPPGNVTTKSPTYKDSLHTFTPSPNHLICLCGESQFYWSHNNSTETTNIKPLNECTHCQTCRQNYERYCCQCRHMIKPNHDPLTEVLE